MIERWFSSRAELAALVVVLLVALTIRLWGSFFGLPHVYHPDEGFEVYRALRLGMGGFDTARIAKGGYYFLLFVEYGAYFAWMFVTGAVSSASQFAEHFVRDPSPFWKIGRVTTAFLGTATVLLVWWQGRRMGSTRAGLLGAWFLALSFRHVVDSHYVTVDVPMTLFAFWTVCLVVEDVSGRGRIRTWTFALVAAYAVLNKIPAALVFVPYFVGALMRGGLRGPRGLLTGATILPVGLSAAIFLAANPGIVFGFRSFVTSVLALFLEPAPAGSEYDGVEATTNLWVFYGRTLLESQGPALLALSGIGAVLGLLRRSQAVILHLAFIVPFYVLIAGSATNNFYYSRYIVPMLPGLCLLAGLALDDLVRRSQRSRGPAGVIAVATALLLVVEPGLAAVKWDQRQTRVDTRSQAVSWIEENVDHHSRILLEGFPEETAQLSIPLRDTKQNVRKMIERLRSTDPGKALFWEMKLEHLEKPLYDLVTVRHYEPWEPLREYAGRGVEYVVLRREFFIAGEKGSAKIDPGVVSSRYRFYAELVADERARRVAFFPASEDGAPGYDLEIWRLGRPEMKQTLAAGSGG